MEINEIMLNPIRMRIVQIAAANEKTSASYICEKMPDIPRTTIYRHIKILIDNEILTVVAENKIRGSLERILSLSTAEIAKHNTLDNAKQNIFGFMMQQYAKFERYFNSEDPDPARDCLFYNNTIMMLTDEEYSAFLKELQLLLQKYSLEYTEERKVRDISIISAPNENQGDIHNENKSSRK